MYIYICMNTLYIYIYVYTYVYGKDELVHILEGRETNGEREREREI